MPKPGPARPGSAGRQRIGLRGTAMGSPAVLPASAGPRPAKDSRSTVAVRVLDLPADSAGADAGPQVPPVVRCDEAQRRVWIERPLSEGADKRKGGLFSSTFDCVTSEASLAVVFATAVEPAVSRALAAGAAGPTVVLCCGDAEAAQASLLGSPSEPGLLVRTAELVLAAVAAAPEQERPLLTLTCSQIWCDLESDLLGGGLAAGPPGAVAAAGGRAGAEGAAEAAAAAGVAAIAAIAAGRVGGAPATGRARGTQAQTIYSLADAEAAVAQARASTDALCRPTSFAHTVASLKVAGPTRRGRTAATTAQLASAEASGLAGRPVPRGPTDSSPVDSAAAAPGGAPLPLPVAGAQILLVSAADGMPTSLTGERRARVSGVEDVAGAEAALAAGRVAGDGGAGSRASEAAGGTEAPAAGAVADSADGASALKAAVRLADKGRAELWERLATMSRGGGARGRGRRTTGGDGGDTPAAAPLRLLARAVTGVLEAGPRTSLVAVSHVRARGGDERRALGALQQAQVCARVRPRAATDADDKADASALQSLLDAATGREPSPVALEGARTESRRLHGEARDTAARLADSMREHIRTLRQNSDDLRREAAAAAKAATTEVGAGGGVTAVGDGSGGTSPPGASAGGASSAEVSALAECVRERRALLLSLREEAAGAAPGLSSLPTSGPHVAEFKKEVDAAWEALATTRKEVELLERSLEESQTYQAHVFEQRLAAERALQAVADNLHLLGWEKRNAGHPVLAVPLYAAALAIYEAVLGPQHPQAASTLVNLGNALFDLGRHAEAAALYRRSLAIDEEVLGDDHPDVAMDLSNLGIVYRNMGHIPHALALFDRAHALLRRALGDDHASTVTVARNLGKLRAICGDAGAPGADGPDASAALVPHRAALTPRGLAEEVTSALAEDTYAETAVRIGAHLLREHVAAARAEAGLNGADAHPLEMEPLNAVVAAPS